MATTTNYGWTTPDDTSLVKDGAAAIRTLGSSIDTTTKALNPSTTLGDIEYRSSTANTNTRLGIGTTGQVLTVASGVPSWATPAAGGGYTLLSTTTLSGTTTTISSISQSYLNLRIIVRGLTFSSNPQDVWCGFNGTYSGTAQIMDVWNTSSASGAKYGRAANQITDGSYYLSAGNSSNAWTIDVANYAQTNNLKIATFGSFYNATTGPVIGHGSICTTSSSAITSITMRCLETFTAGTVLVYGAN